MYVHVLIMSDGRKNLPECVLLYCSICSCTFLIPNERGAYIRCSLKPMLFKYTVIVFSLCVIRNTAHACINWNSYQRTPWYMCIMLNNVVNESSPGCIIVVLQKP